MNGNSEKVTPLRPKRPCPECGRPSARETYPFCSQRCKNVDLNRWLSGSYVLPGAEDESGEEGRPKGGREEGGRGEDGER